MAYGKPVWDQNKKGFMVCCLHTVPYYFEYLLCMLILHTANPYPLNHLKWLQHFSLKSSSFRWFKHSPHSTSKSKLIEWFITNGHFFHSTKRVFCRFELLIGNYFLIKVVWPSYLRSRSSSLLLQQSLSGALRISSPPPPQLATLNYVSRP